MNILWKTCINPTVHYLSIFKSDNLHNPPDTSTSPFMRSNYGAKYFSKLFALRYPWAKFTAENYKESAMISYNTTICPPAWCFPEACYM